MPGSSTSSKPRLPGRVLMLPADGSPAVAERLAFEFRYVHNRLARRGCGDQLEQLPGADIMLPTDLFALVTARADLRILHISGRCGTRAPVLRDTLFEGLLALRDEHELSCVVLNVRHDPEQAHRLGELFPLVGFGEGVASQVATVFAGHFYVQLLEHEEIEDAYTAAVAASKLALAGRPAPTLYPRASSSSTGGSASASSSSRPRLSTPASASSSTRARLGTPASASSSSRPRLDTPSAASSSSLRRDRLETPARARSQTPETAQPEAERPRQPLPPLARPRRDPSSLTNLSPASASASTLGGRVPITDDETEMLLEAIEDHAGISLSINSDRFLLRLSSRLDALGLSTYREYYRYLYYNEDGPAEMEELIEMITTHETYFFREQSQLEALTKDLLPQLAKQLERQRSLRIWSAGCSTGEEVYTLAILLLESGLFTRWDISLVGTDISQRVIDTAREGVYGRNSFRTTSADQRQIYFLPDGEGRWRVREDLHQMCRFETLNLLHTETFETLGTQDIILCRNVLIYLSPQTRQRAVSGFFERLVPGGFLLLGHSESLLGLRTRFETVRSRRAMVYRKPGW